MLKEECVLLGLPPSVAERAARIELGAIEQVKKCARNAMGIKGAREILLLLAGHLR